MWLAFSRKIRSLTVAALQGPLRVTVAVVLSAAPVVRAVEWVRGGDDGQQATWGIQGGLQFAIPPASYGPRGLIRILYPALPDGRYDLINFIAVEPIVRGSRGFSELERSTLDGVPGKRFWTDPGQMRGRLARSDDGVETLHVVIHVEPFENGAGVRLLAEQRSDRPDELALTVEAGPGSASMEYCILTATMGNRARTRLLWLKDETINSLALYSDYRGADFTPHTIYSLKRLAVTQAGELLAAITTDENRPADVYPFPGSRRWYHGGFPVTQFWKKAKDTWRDDLHVAVNARYMYWKSDRPIPGGISFENFEFRERFHPGQQFIFGITGRSPAELGIDRNGCGPS